MCLATGDGQELVPHLREKAARMLSRVEVDGHSKSSTFIPVSFANRFTSVRFGLFFPLIQYDTVASCTLKRRASSRWLKFALSRYAFSNSMSRYFHTFDK